jgi:hypothetical protein
VHGLVDAPKPADLDPAIFAQRLGQSLFNTWWLVSIGRELITSGVEVGKVGRIGEDVLDPKSLQLSTTSGTLSHEVAVIERRMCWFIVLVVVSLVLIIASILPLMLRFWTHTPASNLLLSTMLKDSPYFDAPKTGSTLESSDRSRLLRRRRVRLGDVAADDAVRYLAIGSLDDDGYTGGQVGRAQKDRLYG